MEKYRKALPINDTDLDSELCKQSATFMYVAEESAKAQAQLAQYKAQAEADIATVGHRVRQELEELGGKVTEKLVEQQMASDKEYLAIKKKLAMLAYNADMAKALERSWYMRKDMLTQVAIRQRAELSMSNEAAA